MLTTFTFIPKKNNFYFDFYLLCLGVYEGRGCERLKQIRAKNRNEKITVLNLNREFIFFMIQNPFKMEELKKCIGICMMVIEGLDKILQIRSIKKSE